jgi:hypothetical protein
MPFIRGKKVGGNIYYYEVENKRVDGKVVQEYIRYIGKNKNSPSGIPLQRAQFSYIATRLMQGDFSANELMDVIERMGHRVNREDMERIGLFYDIKKTPFPFHCTGRGSETRKLQAMRKKTERASHI